MRSIRQPFASHPPEENRLMRRWIVVTSLSLAVGFVLAEVASSVLTPADGLPSPWSAVLGSMVLAACVGLPVVTAQYVLLRRRLPYTRQWLVAGAWAAVGGLAGFPLGYAAGLFAYPAVGSACHWVSGGASACFPVGMFAAFVAAGAMGGMIIGGLMGLVLEHDSHGWTKGWLGRLSGSWALVGALFWAAAASQGWFSGRVLNNSVTATSLAIAVGVGLMAGAAGGFISGCQFVRSTRPQTPGTPQAV